eukprot:Lithocolla_globosa_v1_NODE_808_length_3237_cov_9.760876.p3 type:complete len:150 gc:universal NODE_808_length_3237_cov_9.760876:3236-2787(-)
MFRMVTLRRFSTKYLAPFLDVHFKDMSHKIVTRHQLEYDSKATSFIEQIRTGQVKKEKLPVRAQLAPQRSHVDALIFPTPFESSSPVNNVLYCGEYYDRLFALLRTFRRSILNGNPGISKSWFQFYMMWRLGNGDKLPPNHWEALILQK